MADRLILEFKNLANLQNPIIVDKNDIILDGNHRAFVFKRLKFRFISVCKIDYFDESTRLLYWFRLLEDVKSMDLLKQIVEDMEGSLEKTSDRESLKRRLEERYYDFGIQHGDFYASVRFPEKVVNDAVSAYDVLGQVQEKLIQKGLKLKYIPCQSVYDSEFCNGLKDDDMVIWTPQITKEMVIWAAKRKKIFAPKTTRHVIAARPLNVNVPAHWFKQDIALKAINEKFTKFLENKSIRHFGPGQVVDGRYYGEELFVFL